ncbi:MAG: hypothetical protein OER97_04125 [Gammaproteobacteria bacterium]|nr:hypothetical protein [Gammaproteobacteria bacterium]
MITFKPITIQQTALRGLRQAMIFAVLLPAIILVAVPTASAQDGTGETIINQCMDDLFPGNLGCTANDVRVSGVADVTGDGIVNEDDITFEPVCDIGADLPGLSCDGNPGICTVNNVATPGLCGDRCAFPGDTTSFAATFEVELSAQERFDIGLYFDINADPEGDGALTGTCSISTLPEVGSFTRPDGSTGNFVDLDTNCNGGRCPQPEDLCGDIDNANNPIFYDLSQTGNFIAAVCVDPDGDGQLNLPNCTSWRQSGANEVCTDPDDAFPGSPSKCNCDPEFQVPINVPPAELLVVKTANPTTVDEPGGVVTFTVEVTNTGIDPNNDVTLNAMVDDVYGDLDADDLNSHTWLTSDCLDDNDPPVVLTPNGGTYTCMFTGTVSGNGGESQRDIVIASGVDDNGNPISGDDFADVDIVDVLPAISVTKTANPDSVTEPGANVEFTVVVSNDSTADPLTITLLTDERPLGGTVTDIGNLCLDGSDNSLIGQTIPQGGPPLTCTFTVFVDGNAGEPAEVDKVTVTGEDDEPQPNSVSAYDTASVSISDDEAMIKLTKTANPTSVPEPGGDVMFTLVVDNLSLVDPLTITSLTDERPLGGAVTDIGNLCLDASNNSLIGQTITAGGSLTCTFVIPVTGDASDVPPGETDLATVEATDDDLPPNTVSDDDDATVTFLDVPPSASLTKTATMVVATFDVVVTNTSSAEAISLDALVDDQFPGGILIGDIDGVTILNSTCSVPQTLEPNDGQPGGLDEYTCSYDAKINTSPHVDTVTGTVSDNDGGSVMPSDSAEVTFGDP